jgi:hypothetical protein
MISLLAIEKRPRWWDRMLEKLLRDVDPHDMCECAVLLGLCGMR